MNGLIRRAAPEDWPAIARLCEDTGRQGNPVDDSERGPFGEHWIGPYRELRPDWTWVFEAEGKVLGYLTGCPDSLAFEKERRRVFNPGADSRQFFSHEFILKLWAEHPAHVHMNIAAGLRGRGAGAALLRAFFAALKAAGVPSAHVMCGPTARSYWEHAGFKLEAQVEAIPGVMVSALIRPVV